MRVKGQVYVQEEIYIDAMTQELADRGLNSSKFFAVWRWGEKRVIHSLKGVVPELLGKIPAHQLIDEGDDHLKLVGVTEEQISGINSVLLQLAREERLI